MTDTPPRGATARVLPSGPLSLTGRVRVEASGETVAENDAAGAGIALCRCGRSRSKPLCDGSHRGAGFADPGLIQGGRLAPGSGGGDDEPVVIACAPNGPLLVRGLLAVVASDGEEARGARGALCRCGASATKPFCDGAHRAEGFVAT